MTVKVAVFGREEIINRVQALIEMKGNIEMIPFPYHEAIETRELIERAVMCDVYLFTEALSYLFVKDKIEVKRLPTINVELDEYAILTSFYHLVYDKKEAIDRISIDLLEVCHVEEVLQELKLTNRNVYTYSYGHLPLDQIDSIIFHHKNLWDNDKIDYVLTSSHEVSLRLTNMDIPNYYMQIPQANLEHALKRAKSMIALNKSISSQIVAGYVRLKDQHPTSKKGRDEQDKIYKNLHVILKRFAQKTYASLLTDDKNNYIIFGTRGVLDHITNHFRTFPLLEEIEETLDIPVEIGFGLGLTAKQAEKHAQLALETCSKDPVSCCYIVNDRQETIGPIGVKRKIDTSKLYRALIHQARLNNELSYNFIDFITLRNNEPFSSHDVAQYYQVTKRSAERTINKLLSGQVIKVVGEEKPYVKGRPRKLFQIDIGISS